MSKVWKAIGTLTAALILIALAQPLIAQTPVITAEVDQSNPTLYDTVTLTITVTGENNIRPPVLPTLSGFQIKGSEITSQQTFRNGKVAAEFKFIVELQPRHTGTIEIGPVQVPVGGDVYETDPITLDVTHGTPPTPTPFPVTSLPPVNSFLRPQSQPNQGDPSFQSSESDGIYFVESEVDNYEPYLGEQITYFSKFYATEPSFIRPIHRAPDFVGFWDPDRKDRQEYPDFVEGAGYKVTEYSAILFPTIAGSITIEPTSVGIPGGFFSSSFMEYASPAVELQVKPLPLNEPPSFTGAVGKYDIEASLDTDSLILGESATLTVTILGQGNFDTLPDPTWQDVSGWRAFENDSVHRSFVEDGVINGIKTFQRVLVPNEPGDFDLPSIQYSYFDPDLEEYVTVSTDAITVRVAPDPDSAAIPDLAIDDTEADAITEIRHIKPAPRGIGSPSAPTHISPAVWGLGGLPVATLVALIAWRWVNTRRLAAIRANAPIRARELALSRLSDLDPVASGADVAAAALHGYLSVIVGQSSSSLLTSDLKELLHGRGVKYDTTQRLEKLLGELDQIRFAPQGMSEVVSSGEAVAAIVRRIESEIQA